MPDPKKLYDSIPMRNRSIDSLKSKFKIGPSGMPYNPAYKVGRNPKVKDSIISKLPPVKKQQICLQ